MGEYAGLELPGSPRDRSRQDRGHRRLQDPIPLLHPAPIERPKSRTPECSFGPYESIVRTRFWYSSLLEKPAEFFHVRWSNRRAELLPERVLVPPQRVGQVMGND